MFQIRVRLRRFMALGVLCLFMLFGIAGCESESDSDREKVAVAGLLTCVPDFKAGDVLTLEAGGICYYATGSDHSRTCIGLCPR